MNSETRICQNCKKDFVIEQDDFDFYEKIKVPAPTFCPECRLIRRMTWRNERSLFKRVCDYSKESIITMFHPEANVKIYNRDIWWSDKWDPKDHGIEYDFSRPFFEQYKDLLSRVPLQNLGNENCDTSKYVNHSQELKNCYLVFASHIAEDTMYSLGASNLKNCLDTYKVQKCENCYEMVLSNSSYNVAFSFGVEQCIDSVFLMECTNCQDCIGCMNLRNKRYCIFNRQCTKEQYFKIKQEFNFKSYQALSEFKKKYKKFILNYPYKFAGILRSNNCTGDNIINSKNIKCCFDSYGGVEDSKYMVHGLIAKDSYDCYGYGGIASVMYEGVDAGLKAYHQHFSVFAHSCIDTNYTYMCYDSGNLFGCIGIRKGSYCILNKQYTKEEYEELVPKIIQHMNDMPYIDSKGRIYKYGEFFPPELSPFCYNETIAQEYFPLTKEQALEQGYKWKDREERNYKIDIKSEDIPDDIKDVDETILGKVIECEHKGECNEQCTEAFKITESELQFYKRMNLPIPHLCPNCRHYQRLKQRNPLKLWHRQCMCDKTNHNHKGRCSTEFETSYSPDRPEIIYCEECYKREVY